MGLLSWAQAGTRHLREQERYRHGPDHAGHSATKGTPMTAPDERAAAEWLHANKWTYGTNMISMLRAYADHVEATHARRLEEARAALERIVGMCAVPATCTWGRPNGTPAVVSCAKSALARLSPPPPEGGR